MKKITLLSILILVIFLVGCAPSKNIQDTITLVPTKESSKVKDNDIYREALSMANSGLCNQINDDKIKEKCYFYTIIENKESNKCDVLGEKYKFLCNFVFFDEEQVCEESAYKEKSFTCENLDSRSLMTNLEYGLFKNELNIREVEDCKEIESVRVKDSCYVNLALFMFANTGRLPDNFILLNDKIENQQTKDRFIKIVAYFSNNTEYCDMISDADILSMCKKGEIDE